MLILCAVFALLSFCSCPHLFAQSSAGAGQSAIHADAVQALPDGKPSGFHDRAANNGILLDLQVQPLAPGEKREETLRTGQDMNFRLTLRDAETGSPLTGLRLSAWMHLNQGDRADVPCKTLVKTFYGASFLPVRPELDLNAYYAAVLNEDASISIVDPQFSSGRSKLISSIPLAAKGQDWLLNSKHSNLFVSMPAANQIAVIDTSSWRVIHTASLASPVRLGLQPDEQYLWVSYQTDPQHSGFSVWRAADLSQAARFDLGSGAHDIAFSSDSRFAIVTSEQEGSVTIFDIPHLAKVKEIKTGGQPSSVAYSPISQAAYAVDRSGGVVLAISVSQQEILSRIEAAPGITRIAFPRDGRYGFVLNPAINLVYVLDTARNRFVQSAEMGKGPAQIAFSDQFGYVVSRNSDLIQMLPLDHVGQPDTPLSVVDLPAGRSAMSANATDELASPIAQIPGENAVIIANPNDRAVYYYDEGMAAPMGTFSNFGKRARAVLTIDRSFKENAPGIYETFGRLSKSGLYTLSLFLDSPQTIQCFQVPVGENTNALPFNMPVLPDSGSQRSSH